MTRSGVQSSPAAPEFSPFSDALCGTIVPPAKNFSYNDAPDGSLATIRPQTLLPFTDIKRSFMEARKLAGLDDVHIHDLRHSYASALAGSGVDLYTVGKLLGHVNWASDARYAHLGNETLLAAAEASAGKLNVN